MRAIPGRFFGKLFSTELHLKGNLKKMDNLKPTHQAFRICRSKLHTMVCLNMKQYPVLNTNYVGEEQDFGMVLVRAPPGAAESTSPGLIEWEKTVGSRVTAGEVVCRIRFKEERSLDIKSPVSGVVAVRKKNEGDTVAYGDELFRIRIDAPEGKAVQKKLKKKKIMKDYYEEEEGFVGKSKDRSEKQVNSKSSPDAQKAEMESSERKKLQTSTLKQHDSTEEAADLYKHSPMQAPSQLGLVPTPYSQPIVSPISQLMTTINEVKMEDTVNFINKYAGYYEVKYGNKPCLRSIYIKTAAHALKLNKELNIKLVNDEQVESKDLEITVAIRHLKVLVFHTIKNVDQMSYVDITRLIFEIEKQIAAGTFKVQKSERGFTISPEWEIGSIVGTPVHSKICTLGIHSIIKRPIFEENKIVAYPMMYVSLTYDSKLIEDEKAIQYLKCFKESMEDPRHILVHSA